MKVAGLRARLAAMVYEALLLAALLFVATALFIALFGDSRRSPQQGFLQLYLFLVAGSYFVWSWTAGRRTLPMRTWRIWLVERSGRPVRLRIALARYLAAVAGIALGGVGVAWAIVDPEGQFLHDRLAGTRLIVDPDKHP
jgi:uncharacterized RDD family membrane protein YckC